MRLGGRLCVKPLQPLSRIKRGARLKRNGSRSGRGYGRRANVQASGNERLPIGGRANPQRNYPTHGLAFLVILVGVEASSSVYSITAVVPSGFFTDTVVPDTDFSVRNWRISSNACAMVGCASCAA